MEHFYNFIRKFCVWRRNNEPITRIDYSSDESDDDTFKQYVDQREINEKLKAKFGSDKVHVKNLSRIGVRNDLTALEILGSGAFSLVIKVFSSQFAKDVAVKIIRLDEQGNQSYVENYLSREIKLWKKVSENQHQNILNLLESFSMENYMYTVTEVVSRGDIHRYLLSGTMSECKAKTIFREIVSAVSWCHYNNVAHRDIKPENLLLGNEDKVKLADFSFVTDENPVISQHCGTPGMIAPEQASGKTYDPFKSDIWQLGVTLYMMLCKKKPYSKSKKADVLTEIQLLPKHLVYKNVPYPKNKMLSVDCKELLANMLKVEVEERFTIHNVEMSDWVQK